LQANIAGIAPLRPEDLAEQHPARRTRRRSPQSTPLAGGQI